MWARAFALCVASNPIISKFMTKEKESFDDVIDNWMLICKADLE